MTGLGGVFRITEVQIGMDHNLTLFTDQTTKKLSQDAKCTLAIQLGQSLANGSSSTRHSEVS